MATPDALLSSTAIEKADQGSFGWASIEFVWHSVLGVWLSFSRLDSPVREIRKVPYLRQLVYPVGTIGGTEERSSLQRHGDPNSSN